MTEWAVVGVIVVLVGLVASVMAPVIRLNSTLVKLDTMLTNHNREYEELKADNAESHKRIWKSMDEQGERISANTSRLSQHDTAIELLKHRTEEKAK